eukprot:6141753-Amphidinium_carterae.1
MSGTVRVSMAMQNISAGALNAHPRCSTHCKSSVATSLCCQGCCHAFRTAEDKQGGIPDV